MRLFLFVFVAELIGLFIGYYLYPLMQRPSGTIKIDRRGDKDNVLFVLEEDFDIFCDKKLVMFDVENVYTGPILTSKELSDNEYTN